MDMNVKEQDTFFKPIILLTAVGLAFSGPLGRLALQEGMSPIGIAFWRMLIAGVLSFFISMMGKKSRESYKDISKNDLFLTTLAGFFMAGHFFFWYTSLEYTTIFHATVLGCLQPVFAMVIGYLMFKERVNRWGVIGIAIAMIGTVTMTLMSLNDPGASIKGDLFAVLMGLFLTFYLIFGRKVRMHLHFLTYTTLLFFICAVVLLIAGLLSGANLLPFTPGMLWVILLIVFFANFLGHTIYNWALPHVGVVFITVIMLSEPVGASIVAWIMFNEAPTMLSAVGALMILIGMGLYTIIQNKINGKINKKERES